MISQIKGFLISLTIIIGVPAGYIYTDIHGTFDGDPNWVKNGGHCYNGWLYNPASNTCYKRIPKTYYERNQ